MVGAAIVDSLVRPRLLLAARRTAPVALAGRWELPGGKVEAGETPEQALHRELHEELAVRAVLGEELVPTELVSAGAVDGDHGVVWRLAPGLVLRVWLTRLLDVLPPELPLPREDHDELRWLSARELPSVPWLSADAAVVDALGRRLGPRVLPPG